MDLNCLLHHHQTALMGAAAARSAPAQDAWSERATTFGDAITDRQRTLGATFPLVGRS